MWIIREEAKGSSRFGAPAKTTRAMTAGTTLRVVPASIPNVGGMSAVIKKAVTGSGSKHTTIP
jgi:hypothetical protein